jgi:hypothetical protein
MVIIWSFFDGVEHNILCSKFTLEFGNHSYWEFVLCKISPSWALGSILDNKQPETEKEGFPFGHFWMELNGIFYAKNVLGSPVIILTESL